ncbi:SGNH/GDSL hydrolase family protein [Pedobacter jamesrossensis]|uniref:SGNH/GDSL hydrolase family protein n=1 Tax=Pedobacter jamesrossensis TaxID=1908238 RepID=A0ABV8NMK7_9SPHI
MKTLLFKKTLLFLCLFPFTSVWSQSHPLPVLPDTSLYGKYTSRTMHLLQSSTPEHRNTVKILVYGQSISAQNWWLAVKKYIEVKYPWANLIMENRAIGGFASQLLSKTVEMDVSSFYPDLVLLHIYGSNEAYESVLKTIRSRTIAEIAIQTDHYTGKDDWSDNMSYQILPALATKYKCDILNIRDPWKEYLKDNHLDSSKLLSDGVHLNDFGNYLMAELVKPLFMYKSKYASDPLMLKTVFIAGNEFKITGKKLSFEFIGNRVDLILDSAVLGNTVQVLVDGKKPSDFQGTYYTSRPYNANGSGWPWNLPSMIQVQHTAPWVNENWTLTYTDAKAPFENFKFEIQGSVTGKDGSGKSSEDFNSPSGKIIIKKGDADEGGDWHVNRSYKVLKTEVKPGDKIFWKTYSISANNFITEGQTITLFQGIPNTKHILTLIMNGKSKIPVKEIIVYKPHVAGH